MTKLIIHDIGRAGQSDATTVSEHVDVPAALASLYSMFSPDSVRGVNLSGTIGSGTYGRTFQASKTWRVE